MSTWLRFRRLPLWLQLWSWLLLWPVPVSLWAITRPRRTGPLLLALASTAAWVAVPAYARQQRSERHARPVGSTTPRPASAAATSSMSQPTTTSEPEPDLLARLRVAPEGARTGYDRDLFPHWADVDHDRCNTREEVLVAESTTPAQVEPYSCKVLAGDWFSVYDGVSTDDPADLQIDHVVALAEAWDSGAVGWDTARRRKFANDLDDPAALVAVTGSSNQAKSDHDPAGWRPPRREAWCTFATDWVTVKVKWDLTADQPEVAALRELLATC